jgi:tetratricopeptide (TPR) repeat protein
MKALSKIVALFLLSLLFSPCVDTLAQQKPKSKTAQTKTTPKPKKKNSTPKASPTPVVTDEATDLKDLRDIVAISYLPERIEKLKAFVQERPKSTLKARALELIVSAQAALGEEKLRSGDTEGGLVQFRLAVQETPQNSSDKLFEEVLSQIPSNLFLRGQGAASVEVARMIEEKVKDNPKRLLALVAFYISLEAADDAIRVSQLIVKLAPDMTAAYQALGASHRIAFQLDQAAEAYAKAVVLDYNSVGSRRSLADIRRAQGRIEEALLLYRGLIQANKDDEFARTGLIMSMFEMGKREDAEKELKAAVQENPNSLTLLTNAAYWYAAHNEGERAVEVAQKAVSIEPRYVWAQIALARGLLATKRPLEAERALLFARQYANFPTLDYEFASVLASAGLYEEAARTLSRSFTVKDGLIETRLAGRAQTQASNFIELVGPERRASIFQLTAADTESNATLLKNLLAFSLALNQQTKKEQEIIAAAQEFASGDDAMKTHRQLYAASRLLQNDVGLAQAFELTQSATSGVDAALDVPVATVAVMADEIYDVRANAASYGASANIPNVQRNVLSNIMRGRIEDIAGWTLFNQNKHSEAIVRLRRAISVLPENSVWWRNATWHLGAAYEANDNKQEALASYFKSYKSGPDPSRRAIIEALYRKVNGTLDGLDEKIGPSPFGPTKTSASDAANNAVASIGQTPSLTQQSNSADAVPTNATDTNTTTAKPVATNPETNPAQTSTPEVSPSPEATPPIRILPVNSGPRLTKQSKPESSITVRVQDKPKVEETKIPSSLIDPTPSPSPTQAETKTETTTMPSTNETKIETATPQTPSNEPKAEPSPSPSNEVAKTEVTKTEVTKTEPETSPSTNTETKTETTSPTQTVESKPAPSPSPEEKPTQPSQTEPASQEKPSQDLTAKVETKPETKVETTPEAKPETKSETKPEISQPTSKQETAGQPETKTKVETSNAESTEQPVKAENAVNENSKNEQTTPLTPSLASRPRIANVNVKTEPTQQTENQTAQTITDENKSNAQPKTESPESKTRSRVVRPRRVQTSDSNETPETNANEETKSERQPNSNAKPENQSSEIKPCLISVSQESVSIINNGGTAAVTVTLEGAPTNNIISVNDWANIAVFLEPKIKNDGRSALYSITSVSKNTGTYKVTFKSSCGPKEVTVNVR